MPAKFHEPSIKSGLKNKRKLSAFIDKIIKKHKKSIKMAQINYIFCDDDFLLQLNKQYLNHDTLTDIITFDLSETDELILIGEIYISIERVKENALKYGVNYDDELLRVIFHGILHLCGLKDKKQEDIKLMRENEDRCIEEFKKELVAV